MGTTAPLKTPMTLAAGISGPAWMSAAVCLGTAETWETAWETARPGREQIFTPDPAQKSVYDRIAAEIQRLYDATK